MDPQHSQKSIFEGTYVEPYTPAAGRIRSARLGKPLVWAKLMLSADADVTFKDGKGNQVSAFPLTKGEHSFFVTEITVVSAGTVCIIHDGMIDTGLE